MFHFRLKIEDIEELGIRTPDQVIGRRPLVKACCIGGGGGGLYKLTGRISDQSASIFMSIFVIGWHLWHICNVVPCSVSSAERREILSRENCFY